MAGVVSTGSWASVATGSSIAVGLSTVASMTTSTSSHSHESASHTRSAAQETATAAGEGYTYSSSMIVRVALAASIIVVVVFATLMAMKISTWIRYNQRMRRETTLRTLHEQEQRAHAFELAAWADQPGIAPVQARTQARQRWWRRQKEPDGSKTKHRYRRGRVNAYAVYEWEGVPA